MAQCVRALGSTCEDLGPALKKLGVGPPLMGGAWWLPDSVGSRSLKGRDDAGTEVFLSPPRAHLGMPIPPPQLRKSHWEPVRWLSC